MTESRTAEEGTAASPSAVDEYVTHVVMSDTDTAGVLYAAAPVRWSQLGFENLLRRAGRPLETILPKNLHYPLVELCVTHHSSLRLGDQVSVRTYVAEVRRRAVVVHTQVTRTGDLGPACTVSRTGVATTRDGTPAEAEPWWRRLVTPGPVTDLTSERT